MERFPSTDGFQQVIFTPVGTIDVIALDQAARRHNAELAASGVAWALRSARGGLARMLHAAADRLEGSSKAGQPAH